MRKILVLVLVAVLSVFAAIPVGAFTVKGGTTNWEIDVKFRNKTTGLPEEDITSATSGFVIYGARAGAAGADLSVGDLATEITACDGTSDIYQRTGKLGCYRLCVANAVVAAGVDHFTLYGETDDAIMEQITVQVVSYNPTDSNYLGLAYVNSIYGKLPSKNYLAGSSNSDGDIQMDEATGNFPGTVGKSAMSLASGDVSGNLPADAVAISGSTTAADNVETVGLAYTAARGLAGTALPDAVADAVGGLSTGDPWAKTLPGSYGLGSAGLIMGSYLDSTISGIPADVLSETIEGSYDVGEFLRIMFAVLSGKLDKSGTSLTFYGTNGTTVRAQFTIDDGDRDVDLLNGAL